ncbi:MAG: phosphoribosylformylglycinamidine synthase subunit PurL [Bacteroidota bacterium]
MSTVVEVNPALAEQLGLTEEEFKRICEILSRTPNFVELSVFSVMWSEHCSYKNSILQLKTLPKEGPKLLAAAGEENAGLMDLGDGLAVAFKIESHNHPSAIEPYQGAATGVGGIHRDIFTMGARPIASLNSLRFGDPELARTQHLVKGVVKGIGDYGNAFGVPTVAGEVYFDPCYTINPLVNSMSVGIAEVGKTASATAEGIGNPVFIVGSSTGKDGIHGATFASEDISEDSEEKLPSVQVGDPFTEKLLLEATLEAIQTGALVGVQDMGAAGITCSSSEMSAKGESGMDLWLEKVPTRQEDMEAWEILLSESQERMLLVVHKGREAEILEIFEKWDLNCVEIGVVTDTGNIRYFMNEELVGEVPAEDLVLGGGAPVYVREQKRPAYMDEIDAFDPAQVPSDVDPKEVLHFLLQLPSIASKKWITQQYDSMVGTANMSTNAPSDAAVVRLMGRDQAVLVTTDCNSRYVYADPEKGCALAVAEAARNIACSGGIPVGVTNCLNFGNPYNPEVYYQFAHAIKGMKAACEKFQTPVTGGNVSFYNQSETGPVFPTPTIGMVGIMEKASQNAMSLDFKEVGDKLYLLGEQVEDIGCSEYLYRYHGVANSPAPHLDLDAEKALQESLLHLIQHGLINSAHDLAEGGLMVAVTESAFPRGLGASLEVTPEIRMDAFLFGEAGGRVLVSVDPTLEEKFLQAVNVPALSIGTIKGNEVVLNGNSLGTVTELEALYEGVLPGLMMK